MPSTIRCAFLSTRNLDGYVVDDDRAYAPLAQRGIRVDRIAWQNTATCWDDYALVVVRSTWDYQHDPERFFALLEHIDASTARLANPLSAMRWNARKTYLQQLQRAGINIVNTRFGDTLTVAALDALGAAFTGCEWIIKPDIGANAGGVFRCSGGEDDATRARILAHFAGRGWLAQPFVESVTRVGEYSLFYFDGTYSHTVLKTPAGGDFRVQEEHGGKIRAVTPDASLRAMGDNVCAALPPDCLYIRVDVVLDEARRWAVMEVELIEPSLYLRMDPAAAERFADALVGWLGRQRAVNF